MYDLKAYRLIACMALSLVFAFGVSAVPRSVGATFSPASSGIIYQHGLTSSTFYELSLEADYLRSVFKEPSRPGIRLSYNYCMAFSHKDYEDGRLQFYWGAGVMAGWVSDCFRNSTGFAGGLTGTLGLEFMFRLPVCISLSISPCVGFQFAGRENEQISMKLYMDGLTWSFMPRLGIKYCF